MATALVSTGIQYPDNTIQTSNVTNTLTGIIAIWSGTTANVPVGWALCDGSNSTPDLRDYFVIGAGNSYAVAATGGSANAILVAHTHDATANTNSNHEHVVSHTHTGSSGANGLHTHTATFAISPGGQHTHTVSVPLMIGPTHTHPYAPGSTNLDGDHTHPQTSMTSSGGHTHSRTFGIGNAGGPGSAFLPHRTIPTSPFTGTNVELSPSSDPLNPETAHTHAYPGPSITSVTWPHQHSATIETASGIHNHTFTITAGAATVPHSHVVQATITSVAPNPHGHSASATLEPATTLDTYSNAGIHTHTITIGNTTESSSSLVDANLPPYYSLAFIMKV